MNFNQKKIKSDKQISLLEYKKCYAKTYLDSNECQSLGYSVFEHSCIVASVAKELIERTPDILSNFIPQYAELPALFHDIGKICPTFQKKIQGQAPELASVNASDENLWGGHSTLSSITTSAVYNYDSDVLAYIVGKHHERYCEQVRRANHPSFGGELWQKEREQCMYDLLHEFYGVETLPTLNFSEEITQYILGLTIVADWIGSGNHFRVPSNSWKSQIKTAIDNVGFKKKAFQKHLSFQDIFSFTPHHTQEEFYQAVTGPGLYILEAPMGLGKTEAALYAAYMMLEQNKASGIYFALPTQLTSEKIHERMGTFLDKIILPSSDKEQFINMLIHGKSWIQSYGLYPFDEDQNLDYSWFATKKRALLASFGVGTIDQALMSVINVKNASVRTFGLGGKVIILDEVHSYDMYTGSLINELITSLLALNCTIIVLSATLTKERRISLFPSKVSSQVQNNAYPLISIYKKEANIFFEKEAPVSQASHRKIHIHSLHKNDEGMRKALEAADNGSQVLWIENTVGDAQERYKEAVALAQGSDIEIGLLHSRFTQKDRSHIEDTWIAYYGKNNQNRYERGRILFGTQVLEQSIDIDADILFTRFCPTDMLFQRFGRLHRHEQNKRPSHVRCEAYFLIPSEEELEQIGINAFGKSQYVYNPYVLLRSYEVWKQQVEQWGKIELPKDIRPLLEATYTERKEIDLLAFLKRELEVQKRHLQTLALRSLTQSSALMHDEEAKTRITDQEQKEILLLRKYHQEQDKISVVLSSEETHSISSQMTLEESKKISVELMTSTVRIPSYAFPKQKNTTFKKLSTLAGGIADCALIWEDTILDVYHEKYILSYTHKLGLLIQEKK